MASRGGTPAPSGLLAKVKEVLPEEKRVILPPLSGITLRKKSQPNRVPEQAQQHRSPCPPPPGEHLASITNVSNKCEPATEPSGQAFVSGTLSTEEMQADTKKTQNPLNQPWDYSLMLGSAYCKQAFKVPGNLKVFSSESASRRIVPGRPQEGDSGGSGDVRLLLAQYLLITCLQAPACVV